MNSLSGPKVDTFSDASALFVNRFVKEDVDVPNEDQAVDFRRWKEQQLQDESSTGAARLREQEQETQRDADRKSMRKVREESWQCCVDSGDRDMNVYARPSAFSINMGQTFQNVVRARLISLEFPNVLNVVNKGNCTLTWVNLEDVDLDFPVYSISIPVGTYNYKTLETQLNNQLHSSDLKRRNGTGTPHFFLVKLDGDTDKVSFSSIVPQATGDNPIQALKDTNKVRVTAKSHGLVTGDVVRVLGAQGALGGISAAELNGSFVISVPVINGVSSKDLFDYEVANVSRGATSNTPGGGKSVQIGKEAPFQFTFQRDPTNASPLLGFPPENSSTLLDAGSFLQTQTVLVNEVITGETTLIVAQGHGLDVGDRIYLNNFIVSPSIYNSITHRGEFFVHRVISPDVFEIDFATTHITDISLASIGTRVVTMYLPNHGFNRIVELTTAPEGTRVVSLLPHNVALGQTLFIRCPDNAFTGAFVVTEILDDDQFIARTVLTTNGISILSQIVDPADSSSLIITTAANHGFSAGDVAPLSATALTVPLDISSVVVTKAVSDTSFSVNLEGLPGASLGTFTLPPEMEIREGMLMSNQDFTLYNVSAVGGFTERDLNGNLFSVRKVFSPDYFAFTCRSGFSTFFDLGGGPAMRINSLVHGWRGTQANDQATGAVYRPIALTGDSYCFLRVPSLGKHSTIINTGPVNNILGKVQLTSPPVTTVFNTAVSGSLEFRDGPLPTLSTIDFQWVDKRGVELDFGKFQWSCVLEIVTLNTVNTYNFQPVRIYLPDPVEQISLARNGINKTSSL